MRQEQKKVNFLKAKAMTKFYFLTHIFLLVLYFHSTGAKIALFRGFSCLTDFLLAYTQSAMYF